MFISVILIILSSYLFAAVFSKNKHGRGETFFLKFLLSAFSQIVLSFEILSLFKAISIEGVLICNAVFSAASAFAFFKSKIELLPQIENFKKNMHLIFKSLKRDKALIFLSLCFILCVIFQLITIFVFPVNFGDAFSYYFPRCTAWIQEGSISHYITPDTRELIMPVNMDLLYTWLMLFTKSERGAAIFSFFGYSGAVYVLFNLLRELNFSMRRSLWAVFVFSSFSLVIIEMAAPCADLFTGALILGSIYLFIKSVKYSDKTALYFSALSAALAAGVKTTALIAAPSVFLIFCFLCMQNKKMRFKPLLIFSGLFIINFLIFSSYNYILNFIDYHNPVSSPEQLLIHGFTDGFKGWMANVIKYFSAVFDLSGLPDIMNINSRIEELQKYILGLFNLDIQTGASNWFPWSVKFSSRLDILNSALGAMGLFAFAPAIICAVKRLYRKKYSNRAFLIGVLALSIIFNILLFSGVMVFAGYNMRYLLVFICTASPALLYSYPLKNRLYKLFLCMLMFIYLVINTHHKPAVYLFAALKGKVHGQIIVNDEKNIIYNHFRDNLSGNAALISGISDNYFIEKLRLNGIKIDNIEAENIEDFDLSAYDFIFIQEKFLISNTVKNFKERSLHPEKYKAECMYEDSSGNAAVYPSGMPVISKCTAPAEYIKSKGFKEYKLQSEGFIILENAGS